MSAKHTTREVERLEHQVALLRQALEEVASAGRVLLQALPVARSVPLALAQGPLLTLTGLAEAALTAAQPQE